MIEIQLFLAAHTVKNLLYLSLFLFCLSAKVLAQTGENVKICNVRDFGATGDGKTLDTEAINKAIASCAESGGGRVLVPEGKATLPFIWKKTQRLWEHWISDNTRVSWTIRITKS
jgi:uncharacterized membrane protein